MLCKVRVKTKSSRPGVEVLGNGELLVRVRAAPERGQANEELCQLLARYFNRPRQAVTIISGVTSSSKRVVIEGVESASKPASGGKK